MQGNRGFSGRGSVFPDSGPCDARPLNGTHSGPYGTPAAPHGLPEYGQTVPPAPGVVAQRAIPRPWLAVRGWGILSRGLRAGGLSDGRWGCAWDGRSG